METADPETRADMEELFPAQRIAATRALLGATIAVSAAFDHLVNEPTGLDREQADLIVRLATSPSGGLRGVDIARQLMISPTRVSRLADRAESAGLVERQTDPADRRAQRLVLTDSGREVALHFAPRMGALLESMVFAEFDEAEITTLVSLLDRLRERAKELVQQAPDRDARSSR